MLLMLTPGPDGHIVFESWLVRSESREPVPSFQSPQPTAGHPLVACSVCGHIRINRDRWEEIETALVELRVMEAAEPRVLRPGLCNVCKTAMFDRLCDL